MTTRETGAPTDVIGGIAATDEVRPLTGTAVATEEDLAAALDAESRRRLALIANALIPAAHGMPSAAQVVDEERLQFVLRSRPDLVPPLVDALRPDLGDDVGARLDALVDTEPTALAALQLVIVAGYYTDERVRDLIGYPGQIAIPVDTSEYPAYLAEGLIDSVVARGPLWRDPQTGQRAAATQPPRTYSEQSWRAATRATEGGNDGHDGA